MQILSLDRVRVIRSGRVKLRPAHNCLRNSARRLQIFDWHSLQRLLMLLWHNLISRLRGRRMRRWQLPHHLLLATIIRTTLRATLHHIISLFLGYFLHSFVSLCVAWQRASALPWLAVVVLEIVILLLVAASGVLIHLCNLWLSFKMIWINLWKWFL